MRKLKQALAVPVLRGADIVDIRLQQKPYRKYAKLPNRHFDILMF